METIESKKLVSLRLKKAVGLISLLRDEIDDLKRRLNLVEMHNEELQELYEKLSADQAALDSAIDSSLDSVDLDILEGSFNADENEEIEFAEDFVVSADAEDDDFSFDEDEEF